MNVLNNSPNISVAAIYTYTFFLLLIRVFVKFCLRNRSRFIIKATLVYKMCVEDSPFIVVLHVFGDQNIFLCFRACYTIHLVVVEDENTESKLVDIHFIRKCHRKKNLVSEFFFCRKRSFNKHDSGTSELLNIKTQSDRRPQCCSTNLTHLLTMRECFLEPDYVS